MTDRPKNAISEIDEILAAANGEAEEGNAPVVPVGRRPRSHKIHDVVRDGRVVEVREWDMTDAEYDEIVDWDARARVDGRPPLSQRPKTILLSHVLGGITELYVGAGGARVPKRIEAGGIAYRGLYYDYAQDPEHWFAAKCVASNSQPLWFAARGVCGAIRVRIFLNQHLPADQVNVVWGKK